MKDRLIVLGLGLVVPGICVALQGLGLIRIDGFEKVVLLGFAGLMIVGVGLLAMLEE